MPRRLLKGTVVSDKCDKTVTVMVERRVTHPLYGKVVRKRRKYAVHDEQNACKVGDMVTIQESRPHSRTKTWEVVLEESAQA
jgi:small subunit ribosomal protein S17